MKEYAFGLDVGTTTLKAVWLDKQNESILLKACTQAPTPEKGLFSESPFDQEQIAQSINTMVTSAKIDARYVNIALSDSQVFSKVIEMPALSDKELSSAIYWEAEQYIPAQLSTMTLDYMVLRRDLKTASGVRMQVLLVAAPNDLLKRYQNLIGLAGFTISAAETEVLSVIRALKVANTAPSNMIINIGNVNTSLAILQNGVLVFTYPIPLGGIAINRAIAADFNFSHLQAEEYKKTYGITEGGVGGKIGKAVEPILFSLISEVKKALVFYSEKYKNVFPITQIQLSGGTAKLPGLDVYFAKSVGIETIIANPWKTLNVQDVPANIIEHGCEYAVAIGLALRDYEE